MSSKLGKPKYRMDDPATPQYAMSGFHTKKGGSLYATAIDARLRTCRRRHDMAAGLAVWTPADKKEPKKNNTYPSPCGFVEKL